MSSYVTYAEVGTALGTKSDTLLSDLTEDNVNTIIENQSGVIDGFVQTEVDLPFASTPQIIKEICMHLVLYKIWSRQSFQDVPKNIDDDHKYALKLLEKIQKEVIRLGDATDYSDDEDDLEEGGLSDNLRWSSKQKQFDEYL